MNEPIVLKNREPAARGGRRLVFVHPDQPGRIIKVFRPEFASRWDGPLGWRRKMRRYKLLFPFLQEVREHLAICAADGRPPKHMQNLIGFAQTDYGLGLVFDAVFDGSGNFAPTLATLIKTGGYTPEVDAAFREFRQWLLDTPIVVTDLRPQNFVCARDERGAPYFVLIDGVGDKTVIPIRGVVRWLNRRSKKRQLAHMDRRFGIPQLPDARAQAAVTSAA